MSEVTGSGSGPVVPEGFTLHTENNAHILLSANDAFLNPVQEFNRDLSVACIRVWSEEMNRIKEEKLKARQEKTSKKGNAKKLKLADSRSVPVGEEESALAAEPTAVVDETKTLAPAKVVILEALSATGLRSIRYAREIPLVKYVIANDLSSYATEAMERNVKFNNLTSGPEGIIRINEGDACSLMYNHRSKKVDVVDLDPYGTASPFIDAAVQSVKDGGLLCITCTDMPVLGTVNYPEKCFSNYGGISVRSEYCHEAALRLVLHAASTSAARYGRYIQPMLSLSIDFYVRLFIKVQTSPMEVKKAFTKTSYFYVCSGCQAFYEQPMGKVKTNVHEASGNVNHLFRTQTGPPVSAGDKCPECNSSLHLAGPMWSGPIQEPEYISKVLKHLDANSSNYGTAIRMKGMMTVAQEELAAPFYFTPAKIASAFHCLTPSLDEAMSALLHAGYKVSRSHACAGSIKTDAPRLVVHDIYRSWIKGHPVKMDKLPENATARVLLAKESSIEANFKLHSGCATASAGVKLVRYQENPTSYWGPGTKAKSGKRKRD